ncbi:unnamed protein product, partial [Timema podura]|nr:unnamed protein product [Timema podura]
MSDPNEESESYGNARHINSDTRVALGVWEQCGRTGPRDLGGPRACPGYRGKKQVGEGNICLRVRIVGSLHSTPSRYSNTSIPAIGSPVYCESDALYRAATGPARTQNVDLPVSERKQVRHLSSVGGVSVCLSVYLAKGSGAGTGEYGAVSCKLSVSTKEAMGLLYISYCRKKFFNACSNKKLSSLPDEVP